MLNVIEYNVTKEPGRKSIQVKGYVPPPTSVSLDVPTSGAFTPTKQSRRRELVRAIVRYFKSFKGRTTSVFGSKARDSNELRLLYLVAKRLFGYQVFLSGVAESAPSAIHAHFVAFKLVKEEPRPLSKKEEQSLCEECSAWLWRWRNRKPSQQNITPSRFLLRSPAAVGDCSGLFYRVPVVLVNNRRVTSGIGHFAMSYTYKSLLAPMRSEEFVASIGISQILAYVKALREVRTKSARLWSKSHSTYNFTLVSILALEVAKQLTYTQPHEVKAYIKYGRVVCDNSSPIRLDTNTYILIGLELLRRDLRDFSGNSKLRRSVNKVTSTFCFMFRKTPTETLTHMAFQHRRDQVYDANHLVVLKSER